MNILMVSGYKRSGKDYTSDLLKDLIPESQKIAFAEPIKDIVAITLGITTKELNELKNSDPYHRKILQRFGTEAMMKHFGDGVWAELLINKLPTEGTVIISDWRFVSEFKAIKRLRPLANVQTIRVVDDTLSGDGHSSENNLDNFNFDVMFDNTAKDDTLSKDVKGWLSKWGTLKIEKSTDSKIAD